MEFTSAGSLLIGTSSEELDALKRRVTLLQDAGLRAEYLSGGDLLLEEPDLLVYEDGDCQLDAQRASAFFQKVVICMYTQFLHNRISIFLLLLCI